MFSRRRAQRHLKCVCLAAAAVMVYKKKIFFWETSLFESRDGKVHHDYCFYTLNPDEAREECETRRVKVKTFHPHLACAIWHFLSLSFALRPLPLLLINTREMHWSNYSTHTFPNTQVSYYICQNLMVAWLAPLKRFVRLICIEHKSGFKTMLQRQFPFF